jgi:hypothetical protein
MTHGFSLETIDKQSNSRVNLKGSIDDKLTMGKKKPSVRVNIRNPSPQITTEMMDTGNAFYGHHPNQSLYGLDLDENEKDMHEQKFSKLSAGVIALKADRTVNDAEVVVPIKKTATDPEIPEEDSEEEQEQDILHQKTDRLVVDRKESSWNADTANPSDTNSVSLNKHAIGQIYRGFSQ